MPRGPPGGEGRDIPQPRLGRCCRQDHPFPSPHRGGPVPGPCPGPCRGWRLGGAGGGGGPRSLAVAMGPGHGAAAARYPLRALALLWAAAVLCQLGSGSVLRRRLHGFLQRRLSGGERRDVQREILAVLGLPGRPRPRAPARAPAAAAPLFMLDLYHAVAGEEEAEEEEEAAVSWPVLTGLSTQSPPPGSVVSRADTVVSLVNMGERRHRENRGAARGTGASGGHRESWGSHGHRGAPEGPGTCRQALGLRGTDRTGTPQEDRSLGRGGNRGYAGRI